MPVEQLYDKAHESMTQRQLGRRAETTFKRLGRPVPVRPVHRAGADGNRLRPVQGRQARRRDLARIDRFIRTYPTHRNIAYMYYLRGLANSSRDTVFLQKVWTLDASRRDLATPMQAYNDFSIVAERYPNSRYAADARQRMIAPAQPVRPPRAGHRAVLPAPRRLRRRRRPRQVPAGNLSAERSTRTTPSPRWPRPTTGLGNETLAADAKRVLQQNDPSHPYLTGNWPDYPATVRKLNPFAGEKSALDND